MMEQWNGRLRHSSQWLRRLNWNIGFEGTCLCKALKQEVMCQYVDIFGKEFGNELEGNSGSTEVLMNSQPYNQTTSCSPNNHYIHSKQSTVTVV
jgi:hypothetical protein